MANPFDEATFFSRRNSLNAQANRARAGVEEQQRLFEVAQAPRAVADFEWQVQRGRTAVPRGLGRRGLLNSGVYRRALADFARDASLGAEDLQSRLSGQRAGFVRALQDIEDQRAQALWQLDLERQGARQQTAAMLRSVLGGN